MSDAKRDTYSQVGEQATSGQMTRQHIYVVDRSPEFRHLVRQLLQANHYNVTTTNIVPLTFDVIERAQPSLLIIDLVLGEQAGWQVLARLRHAASTRGIRVLLVSDTPELLNAAHDRHRQFRGDVSLLKPIDLDEFLRTIEHMVGKA